MTVDNKEIDDLKKTLDGYKETIDLLNAQLEASKQMYNDNLNQIFQLKAANILLAKQSNDRLERTKFLEESVASLTQKLSEKDTK